MPVQTVVLVLNDDAGAQPPKRVVVQRRQLTKGNIQRAFELSFSSSIYLENRYDGTIFFFEDDGTMSDTVFGQPGDNDDDQPANNYDEHYQPEFIVRTRTQPQTTADAFLAGTEMTVGEFSPGGIFGMSHTANGTGRRVIPSIPQRHHRGGASAVYTPTAVRSTSVTATVGAWCDTSFNKFNRGNHLITVPVSEDDSSVDTVTKKLVEEAKKGKLTEQSSDTQIWCLANRHGIIQTNLPNAFEAWKDAKKYGTKLTILPQPPSAVPKCSTKRKSSETAVTEEQLSAILEKIRKVQENTDHLDPEKSASVVSVRRIANDFTCGICYNLVNPPITVCLTCRKVAGCEACVKRAVTTYRYMPCCRGNIQVGGKKYLELLGLDGTLGELNKWNPSAETQSSTSSSSTISYTATNDAPSTSGASAGEIINIT